MLIYVILHFSFYCFVIEIYLKYTLDNLILEEQITRVTKTCQSTHVILGQIILL